MSKRRFMLLLASAAVVGAVAPAVLAGTPKGNGLYGEHLSYCTGAFTYGTADHPLPVTLVPGNGNSFWVAGHHLVILSAEVTDTATHEMTPYTFGAKTGLAGSTVTCTGEFPGYSVVSHDVLVP